MFLTILKFNSIDERIYNNHRISSWHLLKKTTAKRVLIKNFKMRGSLVLLRLIPLELRFNLSCRLFHTLSSRSCCITCKEHVYSKPKNGSNQDRWDVQQKIKPDKPYDDGFKLTFLVVKLGNFLPHEHKVPRQAQRTYGAD